MRWALGALLAIAVALHGAPAAVALPDPVPCEGCWQPALVTSWQWQLQGRVELIPGVQMYDVDGFDASRRLVRRIHRHGAAAVCYLSAGSFEDWRPDANRFPEVVLGRSNGWPGERWLDIRRRDVLAPIMRDRIAMCARKGFDGVEFDNVDGYANRTGFALTGRDQLRYNVWLANEAHAHGLSVALKNDLGQIPKLLPYFDYALNEQCFQYDECRPLSRFVRAGKAVFGVEYRLRPREFCPQANAMNLNFLKKRLSLRRWRIACR
jgi:hypothetical protein